MSGREAAVTSVGRSAGAIYYDQNDGGRKQLSSRDADDDALPPDVATNPRRDDTSVREMYSIPFLSVPEPKPAELKIVFCAKPSECEVETALSKSAKLFCACALNQQCCFFC